MEKKSNKKGSIIDEFNRNKRFSKKVKFKKNLSLDYIWECFLKTFKKTFKLSLNSEIKQGIKWNAKIANINSDYEIEKFDEDKKILQIKWKNQNDKYWIKFSLYKRLLDKKMFLKATEYIFREKPFWGMQDTAGLIWLKTNFKKEVKRMKCSIDLVINNNGEIPETYEKFFTSKTYLKKIKLNSNVNKSFLKNLLKEIYMTKSNFNKLETFTSKKNKYSIIYKIEYIDDYKISFIWNQNEDQYHSYFEIINNKLIICMNINTFWGVDKKRKYRLIKSNFNELIKEIKYLVKLKNK